MSYSTLFRPSFAPSAPAALSSSHGRAAELIRRYPHLSQPQIDELADVVKRLGSLDLALLMADEELAPRLDAFCAANRDALSPSWSDYGAIAAVMAFPILAILLFVLLS